MERLTKRNEQNTAYYYPNCFNKCDGFGYSSKCDECDFADKICEKLGQLEDLEEQGKLYRGWIPCEESLPEEYKRCIVCLRDGDIFSAYYSISWGFQLPLREIREDNPVISWQPLPEPYKPEEEELGE